MTNEINGLKLEDLNPQVGVFSLSTKPGVSFSLNVFSLSARIWVNNRFGKTDIKRIFAEQDIAAMAEIAHHLLIDKSLCTTFEDFAKLVVTVKDQIELTKALLKTIGVDDALILSLSKKMDAVNPNGEAPNPNP